MTEKANELREILINLWDNAITEAYRSKPACYEPFIDQAIAQIKAKLIEEIEKLEIHVYLNSELEIFSQVKEVIKDKCR